MVSRTRIIEKIHLYTDGASRGNPGNAAIAFIILNEDGRILSSKSESVGMVTNNHAEYLALLAGLEEASTHTRKEVQCHSDSELMIKQVNGVYRVTKKHLKQLCREVKGKEVMFEKVTYNWLPRTHPKIAEVDKMANAELDGFQSVKTPAVGAN